MSTMTGLPQNSAQRESLHISSVMAATDFSPASDRAIAEAVSIARHYGAKLHVFNIVSSLGIRLSGAGAMAAATEAAWRDTARLEEYLSLNRLLQGVNASCIVSTTTAVTKIEMRPTWRT